MDQVQKYVFPSIFNPVSHTLLNSVLWPVLSKQFSSWSERQSSARPPRPEVSQSHPRVAKRSFDRSSSRRPCPEVSQRHPRVADHHPTDLKTVSFRCHNRSSARRPLSIGTSVVAPLNHCELVYRIVAELGFVKFTWNEPVLIIK